MCSTLAPRPRIASTRLSGFGLHHAHVVGTLDNQHRVGHWTSVPGILELAPLSEQFQTELIQRLSGHKILYLSGKL